MRASAAVMIARCKRMGREDEAASTLTGTICSNFTSHVRAWGGQVQAQY